MKPPDRIDVAQRSAGRVLSSPFTWLPFLPVAAAFAFLGAPWWICLALAAAIAVAVAAVWGKRWPALNEEVRTGMLLAFREAENAMLSLRLEHLTKGFAERPGRFLPGVGEATEVKSLREAMRIKSTVENRIFADRVITPHEAEVSEMVAELVRTMVAEAERVLVADGGRSAEASRAGGERFEKALATLRRAFEDIEVMLDPVPEDLRMQAENDALSRASERLGERREQARAIRRHMEEGMRQMEGPSTPATTDDASTRGRVAEG